MDKHISFITTIFVIICYNHQSAFAQGDFRGAVVEYGAEHLESSKDTVNRNVRNYGNIVAQLKNSYKDLQIVVFPECGIISFEWLDKGNTSLLYAETVPDPAQDITPCDEANYTEEATKALSCIAKKNSIYLVVNVVESYKVNSSLTLYYNTDAVFDKNGKVIARYRKYNLYGETGFSKPDESDVIKTFDTDFGVKFGIFTCFDILFKKPALEINATHIVFPTAWHSELPYLTAVQTQSAWSYATNKVLMASGYNNPGYGSTGSGIYFGKLPFDYSSNMAALQTQIQGNFAIVSYIPKNLSTSVFAPGSPDIVTFYNESSPNIVPLNMKIDNLGIYTIEPLNEENNVKPSPESNLTVYTNTSIYKTVCDRDLCCEFKVNFTTHYATDLLYTGNNKTDDFGSFKYSFAVFNGVRGYGAGKATAGLQVCSIISCLNKNGNSCGKTTDGTIPDTVIEFTNYRFLQFGTKFHQIEIIANFNKTVTNSFVTSNILLSSSDIKMYQENKFESFGTLLDSSKYEITRNNSQYTFKTKSVINPGTISLYNRIYDWDGQEATTNNKSNSGTYKISIILLIISFIFTRLK